LYSIFLRNAARRGLRHLPRSAREKVIEALKELQENPRLRGCTRLRAGLGWRIRVGEYRIIYDIDDEAREIDVRYVGPRGGAY